MKREIYDKLLQWKQEKSGTRYTLTSLQKCIKKFGQYLSTPYVLHTKDVEAKDGLVYLPLYMASLL